MEGHEPKRTETDAATAENLKRLARMLDSGTPLNLKLNGRRVTLPADSNLSLDLDRDPRSGCVEVDIRWSLPGNAGSSVGNAGNHPGNAGAPACMSAKHENNDTQLPDRQSTRQQKRTGPHIRLKALVTSPTM